jgi:Zn-dependent M32 family carboxypeptidase
MTTVYQKLVGHFSNIGKLSAASMLLMWDRNVVMPTGAVATHGEVAGALQARKAEMAASLNKAWQQARAASRS